MKRFKQILLLILLVPSFLTKAQIITTDPAAYGTEEEVLDLLDSLAAPGTLFRDDAFGGATGWRPGWRA